MATNVMNSDVDLSPAEQAVDGSSMLDRRRQKLQQAQRRAADATAGVQQLEEQIDTNSEQGRSLEAALRAALD